MKTNPKADPDSVNHQLAEFLLARREEIIRAWVDRVGADPAIPTRELSQREVRNHIPRLFDDLAAGLRAYGSNATSERFIKDAEQHGAERWEQGYEIPELLREVMQLRSIFIYHLRVFEESHPDFGSAARLFAHSTIHGFLDEMAIEGTEEFLRSQQGALGSSSGRARHAS
jgi:hypothetical protein